MTDEAKKSPEKAPTWEKDPQGFLKKLATDPVWLNTIQKEKEMRLKFGLPDEPKLKDFPDHASWSTAWKTDRAHFDAVTGCGKRGDEVLTLYWSGAFKAGIGTEADFLRISNRMNYKFGDCTLDEVVAEWEKQNSN
jgi:hypothetical protein